MYISVSYIILALIFSMRYLLYQNSILKSLCKCWWSLFSASCYFLYYSFVCNLLFTICHHNVFRKSIDDVLHKKIKTELRNTVLTVHWSLEWFSLVLNFLLTVWFKRFPFRPFHGLVWFYLSFKLSLNRFGFETFEPNHCQLLVEQVENLKD